MRVRHAGAACWCGMRVRHAGATCGMRMQAETLENAENGQDSVGKFMHYPRCISRDTELYLSIGWNQLPPHNTCSSMYCPPSLVCRQIYTIMVSFQVAL